VARVEVYDAGGRRLPLGATAAVSGRLCGALERAAWGRDLMDAFMRFAAVYGSAQLRVEGGRLVVETERATVAFWEEGGEVIVSVALKVDLGSPEHLVDLVARLAGEVERLGKRLDAANERLRLLEGRLERLAERLERLPRGEGEEGE